MNFNDILTMNIESTDISRELDFLRGYNYAIHSPNVGIPFLLEIKKVIFNEPATIVLWADGSKTVVKSENEKFDPEKGLAMAIAKKAYGNKGNYFNRIKKWTENYDYEAEAIKNDLNSVCELQKELNKLSTFFHKGSREEE